ncbi:MAG: glycosyltransferase 87 family protein [Pseudomonadota bacterium]
MSPVTRQYVLAFLIATVFCTVSLSAFWGRVSPDLLATWMAAEAFANGDYGLIYPPAADLFEVRPPDEWWVSLADRGYTGPVLPYIYPPLWAALLAPATGWVSYSVFQEITLVINHAALIIMILAAWRAATPSTSPAMYLGLALLLLCASPVGALGLVQNQPQILVSCLTVLAIERAKNGSGYAAGAALGLAAALKLSPIFLLPAICVLGRSRPILAGFVVVGGGAGVLSIILAGWPLHRTFLDLIATISATSVISGASWTLTALWAQLGDWQSLLFLETIPGSGREDGWWIRQRPVMLSVGLTALACGVAAGAAIALKRGWGILAIPAALSAFALAAPIAWSFHYLAPVVFLPAILPRLGLGAGLATLVATGLLISFPVLSLAAALPYPPLPDQALGTLGVALMAVVFLALAKADPAGTKSD